VQHLVTQQYGLYYMRVPFSSYGEYDWKSSMKDVNSCKDVHSYLHVHQLMQVEQAGLNQAKARLIAERVDLIVGVLKVSKGGWVAVSWQAAIRLVSLDRTQQSLLLLSHFYYSSNLQRPITSAAFCTQL
jgi:hypothetical protein